MVPVVLVSLTSLLGLPQWGNLASVDLLQVVAVVEHQRLVVQVDLVAVESVPTKLIRPLEMA